MRWQTVEKWTSTSQIQFSILTCLLNTSFPKFLQDGMNQAFDRCNNREISWRSEAHDLKDPNSLKPKRFKRVMDELHGCYAPWRFLKIMDCSSYQSLNQKANNALRSLQNLLPEWACGILPGVKRLQIMQKELNKCGEEMLPFVLTENEETGTFLYCIILDFTLEWYSLMPYVKDEQTTHPVTLAVTLDGVKLSKFWVM